MSPGESTPPRLASPGTFRPQGFAPSRRFSPRLNARPYFMPETPMGFRSPGAFPHRQVHRLVAAGLPSWRFSTASTDCQCEAPASTRRNANHGPLPPPGPCSDSESVPSRDCYILCDGRSPPELRCLSRVLPNTHRPRRMPRVPLLRFALPQASSVDRRQKPMINVQ